MKNYSTAEIIEKFIKDINALVASSFESGFELATNNAGSPLGVFLDPAFQAAYTETAKEYNALYFRLLADLGTRVYNKYTTWLLRNVFKALGTVDAIAKAISESHATATTITEAAYAAYAASLAADAAKESQLRVN